MRDSPADHTPSRRAGTWIVVGMLALAVVLASFAIWYQRSQTRRCLEFYGSDHARRIQAAPRVELWQLAPTAAGGRLDPVARTDISTARGVVHLRRGLVEDANFAWNRPPAIDRPPPTLALAFYDDGAAADPATLLVVGLDERGGAIEVSGRPGVVALGRIAAGLRTWFAEAVSARARP